MLLNILVIMDTLDAIISPVPALNHHSIQAVALTIIIMVADIQVKLLEYNVLARIVLVSYDS